MSPNTFFVVKKIYRFIYKIIYYFYKLFLIFPFLIGKLLKQEDMAANFIIPFAEAAEELSNCYITCNFRPKKAKDAPPRSNITISSRLSDIAIVIQGPLCVKNDFTLETVKLYRKYWPTTKIVISCWKNENLKQIKFLQEQNCEVVLNDYPEFSGYGNMNYQAVSSLNGIKVAKELGGEFVLKQRSDVRICNPEFLQLSLELVYRYPCDDFLNICQKFRFIIFGAAINMPFHNGDFYTFGNTGDMLEYWNYDLQKINNPFKKNEFAYWLAKNKLTVEEEFQKGMSAEGFPYYYFKKKNIDMNVNLEFWHDLLAHYFITLPHISSQFLWYKYDYNRDESNFYRTYPRKLYGYPMIPMDFFQWKSLYDTIMSDKTD